MDVSAQTFHRGIEKVGMARRLVTAEKIEDGAVRFGCSSSPSPPSMICLRSLLALCCSLLLSSTTVAEFSEPHPNRPHTVPGLDLAMVWIEPGTFTMGTADSEDSKYPAERQRSVTLSRGFWLGSREVTVDQWARFVEETRYQTEAERGPGIIQIVRGQWLPVEGSSWRAVGFPQTGSHPAVGISWRDATAFCRWLTERERAAGRLPPDYEYTLPTEAQWEYACRAGSGGRYAFDDERIKEQIWFRFGDGVGGIVSESNTHPVGLKDPNDWGLYDMHGNAFEWCRDWFGEYEGDTVTDPMGPESGELRVCRGGSYYSNADYIRSAYRGRADPAVPSNNIGFRLCLTAVE